MKTARTCLALVAALALAGTASAQNFTEDFDGGNGPWNNNEALRGTNGWTKGSSGQLWTTTGATGGFLGTRGATYGSFGAHAGLSLTQLGVTNPITSGTFTFYIMIDPTGILGTPGGNNRSLQYGLTDLPEPAFPRDIEAGINSRSSDGVRIKYNGNHTDTSIPLDTMRWAEWEMSYNRSTNVLSLAYRDVNDTDGSIPNPTFIAHTSSPVSGVAVDVQTIWLRGFRGNSPPNGVGRVDRISSTPLPEPTALGLMTIGGLMLLRRRRRA